MNIYYIFIVLNGYDEDYGALVIANSAEEAFTITQHKLLNFYLSEVFKGNFSEFIYRKNKQGINQYIYIDDSIKKEPYSPKTMYNYEKDDYPKNTSIIISEYGQAICNTTEPIIIDTHFYNG